MIVGAQRRMRRKIKKLQVLIGLTYKWRTWGKGWLSEFCIDAEIFLSVRLTKGG